jgi:nitrogenase molybdenum-iron protein alpha/beta subunit
MTETLEDFALKGMHLGKMTGISVGVHAIPDCFMLMHTGVGCKYKAAAQIGPHDWAEHPNRREAWTQVGELQLIKGSSERIAPFARSWYRRRRPDFMVVVSAYFIELTGEDCKDVVAQLDKSMPCDTTMITTAAPNGGFFDGYAEVVAEVLERIDWDHKPTRSKAASVVGYFFDRYEADHQANLEQLRELMAAAGVECGPVLLSGEPYKTLHEAKDCAHMVLLPYLGKRARKVRRTTKRKPVALDLPIGVAGSSRFVRELGAGVGADMEAVEAWIVQAEASVQPRLNLVRDNFRNVHMAVFAEAPYAAGLVGLLIELGIDPVMVGIRERYLGGRRLFDETLERAGVTLPRHTEVIEQPSLRLIRERCGALMQSRRLQGVIGSAHELSLFDRAKMQTLMASVSGTGQLMRIETGFPSDNHHASFPHPTFGYAGAVAWAQRILDLHLHGATRNQAVG